MDPALKFVVDVQNSEEVKRLTAYVNQQKEAIAQLNTQLRAGAISNQTFSSAAMPLGQNIARASTELHSLSATASMSGRSLLQLGYAVDDLQYGFRSIVNNIPQMLMFLGPGVAGAAGIAAVAISQLINHWGQLTDAMSGAWSGVPARQLEELREKAEEAAKAFEKLAQTPTKAQGVQVEGAKTAITEVGAENLAQVVAIKIAQDPRLAAEAEKERLDNPTTENRLRKLSEDAFGISIGPAKTEQEIDREQGEARYKKAQEMIGNATEPGVKGEASRLWLRKNAPEVADKIEAASPAGQERIKQQQLELEGGRNERKMEEKLRAEALEEKQQQAVLEAQGRKNDQAMIKKLSVQDLEDQRTQIMHDTKERNRNLEHLKEEMGRTQILQGPKAVSDMYQKAAGDNQMLAIAKRVRDLNERADKNLEIIAKKMTELRRGAFPG